MAKVGDTVRFLNSIGGGRIIRIKDNIAYVEEEDGFETPVLLRECVVVTAAGQDTPRPQASTRNTPPLPSKDTTPQQAASSSTDMEIVETKGGDRLNIVLAYEPRDIKRLSDTSFDVYLVNDSNYYLYFTYLTRSDTSSGWTARYSGIVEPNIQILIDEVHTSDLPGLDKAAVQYVAFKQDKEFGLKQPASVEWRIDTTKFAKLHCFHSNPNFDCEVIAYDIVRDDVPARQNTIDPKAITEGIRQKKSDIRQGQRKQVSKKASRPGVIEVDLHIDELVDSTRGLSNADMLNLQVDKFREVMDANLKSHGTKIIFIHGKGEGVLRQALMKELNHRYKGHEVQDASFREYGYGATQVTIR